MSRLRSTWRKGSARSAKALLGRDLLTLRTRFLAFARDDGKRAHCGDGDGTRSQRMGSIPGACHAHAAFTAKGAGRTAFSAIQPAPCLCHPTALPGRLVPTEPAANNPKQSEDQRPNDNGRAIPACQKHDDDVDDSRHGHYALVILAFVHGSPPVWALLARGCHYFASIAGHHIVVSRGTCVAFLVVGHARQDDVSLGIQSGRRQSIHNASQ